MCPGLKCHLPSVVSPCSGEVSFVVVSGIRRFQGFKGALCILGHQRDEHHSLWALHVCAQPVSGCILGGLWGVPRSRAHYLKPSSVNAAGPGLARTSCGKRARLPCDGARGPRRGASDALVPKVGSRGIGGLSPSPPTSVDEMHCLDALT